MKRLVRDERHAVIGGVAAGFGRYLDVDPVLVRLGFVLLAFANGLGILAYLAGWVLMPRGAATEAGFSQPDSPASAGAEALRDAGARLADEVRRAAAGAENAQAGVGALLLLVGTLLLAHNLGWLSWPRWANFATLWPVLLLALGAGLLLKSRRSSSAAV